MRLLYCRIALPLVLGSACTAATGVGDEALSNGPKSSVSLQKANLRALLLEDPAGFPTFFTMEPQSFYQALGGTSREQR